MLDIGGGSAVRAHGQAGVRLPHPWRCPHGRSISSLYFLPMHVEEALLTSHFAKVVLPQACPCPTRRLPEVGVGGTLCGIGPLLNLKTGQQVPAAGPRTPSQAAGQVRGDDCLHVQHPGRACSANSPARVASQGSVARRTIILLFSWPSMNFLREGLSALCCAGEDHRMNEL